MKKFVILAGLLLAGCGGGAAVIVQNIFDQVNAFTRGLCELSFTFTTIDQMIKAIGGPPIAETIGGILCTQARAALSSEGPAAILGTVIINGRPVTIAVQR
jgi:hypothetical protein